MSDAINAERAAANLEPIGYGIGLNIGTVMYGISAFPSGWRSRRSDRR